MLKKEGLPEQVVLKPYQSNVFSYRTGRITSLQFTFTYFVNKEAGNVFVNHFNTN